MFIVVAYDIREDRRRVKVFKALRDFGEPVQFSVFECDLDPVSLAAMRKKVESLIDPGVDSVRYYALCKECRKGIRTLPGYAGPKEDPRLLII